MPRLVNPVSTNPPPAPGDNRTRAVVAGHTGDEPTARALLGDPSPSVRASALGALERMDRLGPADLVGALADGDALVRRRAATIASRRDDVAVEVLGGMLDDVDDRVVEVVAFACGERDDATDAVVAALERVGTTHQDPLCRESAVAALGSLGRNRSLPAVLAACSDRATVRRRAVLALAVFDDPAAAEALRSMRDDRDLQVRQAAEELLAIAEGGEW
jgi:HEAT repeat protein